MADNEFSSDGERDPFKSAFKVYPAGCQYDCFRPLTMDDMNILQFFYATGWVTVANGRLVVHGKVREPAIIGHDGFCIGVSVYDRKNRKVG